MADSVFIKGTREGLTITFTADASAPVDVAGVLEDLERHLGTRGAFFCGGLVALELGDRAIQKEGLSQIADLLKRHEMTLRTVVTNDATSGRATDELGLRWVRPEPSAESGDTPMQSGAAEAPSAPASREAPPESAKPAEGKSRRPARPSEPAPASLSRQRQDPTYEGGRGILVRHVIRSGQVVRHTGHVTIMGDVNAGGEVVVGGDIIVWGRLYGTAHAGVMGDESAVVCALEMAPLQLRIAHVVARPEDETRGKRKRSREDAPQAEVAYIRGETIVVSPWDKARDGRRGRESS